MIRRSAPTALSLLMLPLVVGAQEPGKIAYQSYSLPNGLEVVLAEDHSAQVVAVDIWYDVGSRNERPGRTGFAHLFEHMMYQGSAHVRKAEHFQLVERAGGTLNGETQDDVTKYWQVLPSNRVNLGLWLEADRMRSLAVTDSNFANQRETVKEERRLRLDNQPYAAAFETALSAVYDSAGCFAYAHPTIGSMADLDSASTADVQRFFKLYYAPNNARLIVAGDINPVAVRQLVERYFGAIPRGEEPPAVSCEAGYHAGPRTQRVNDPLATLPAAVLMYRIPGHDHQDQPALELLGTILGQGESSRLNRRLAREAKAAVTTQAGIFGDRRGPSVFGAFAIANQGVSADSLATLLQAEIGGLAGSSLTEAELTKAKNIYLAGLISSRERVGDIAEALQHAATFHGSLGAANTDYARYKAVTLEDVRRVAGAYLTADNALTLLAVPGVRQ